MCLYEGFKDPAARVSETFRIDQIKNLLPCHGEVGRHTRQKSTHRRVCIVGNRAGIFSFWFGRQNEAAGAADANLAVHLRVTLPRRFSELAVFDARLYIRVRRIDEPA